LDANPFECDETERYHREQDGFAENNSQVVELFDGIYLRLRFNLLVILTELRGLFPVEVPMLEQISSSAT
jgi:hypothetical protein